MATQNGTLKAGYQFVIDSQGAPVDYDVSVTGYAVDFKRIQQKNTLTLGPYKVDCSYSVTVNSGSPVIYKAQPNGKREYSTQSIPSASLRDGDIVFIGDANIDAAISVGGQWRYIPQSKGAIVLDSSVSGIDSGWLPSSVNPERFGFLLTGASAVVSITGSDDAASVAAGYSVTITMDTAASTLVSPPMNFDYKFIKFTVMSLGASSSIKVSRGM